MLTTTLKSTNGNQLIPVNLAGLAMQLRGDIRVVNGTGGRGVNSGPAVFIQCEELRDAQKCLEFATQHQVLIHLFNSSDLPPGNGHCEQGIAVDLRRLKAPGNGKGNGS